MNFEPAHEDGIPETSIEENFIEPAPEAFTKEVFGLIVIGVEPEQATVA